MKRRAFCNPVELGCVGGRNLAIDIDLTVPQSLRVQADEVIQ